MKQIEFRIKELGAIRNSTLTMKPLMLFSGESGLGKSYAAFLVHYLYYLLSDAGESRLESFFIDNKYNFKELIDNAKSGEVILRISAKKVFTWINKDAISYIGYLVGNNQLNGSVEISIPCNFENFVFKYREDLGGLQGQENLLYYIDLFNFTYNTISREGVRSEKPFIALLRAELKDILFGNFKDMADSYLLPPSRGALMEITEEPNFVSGMYKEFWDLKVKLTAPLQKPQDIKSEIVECSTQMNEGSLKRENGMLFYQTHGISMPLTAAASSIKELAPFTLFVNKYSTKGASFLFEEPEAHLHPIRQIKVANLISCMINEGGHMQITTHSDYLIKRFNNLINLCLLKEKMENDDFQDFIKKWDIKDSYLLNPKMVGAYLLVRNDDGTSKIEEQNVLEEKEIPFDSFFGAIEDDINLSNEIRKYLNQ